MSDLSGNFGPSRAMLAWLGRAALAVVYPPVCPACGAAIGEPHALCARCWSGLRLIERPFCERLGTPFPVDLGMSLLSPAAIANPPVFARARAAARFDDTARRLVTVSNTPTGSIRLMRSPV